MTRLLTVHFSHPPNPARLVRTVTASTTREAVGKVQRRISRNIRIHLVTR